MRMGGAIGMFVSAGRQTVIVDHAEHRLNRTMRGRWQPKGQQDECDDAMQPIHWPHTPRKKPGESIR